MATKQSGTTRRLGSRYGRTTRAKLGKIEAMQKKKYKCPKCHFQKVKRVSLGIWQCKKCGAKFTSKAYFVDKMPKIKEKVEE
jgi:large subunit ribosomal protein L37Ae